MQTRLRTDVFACSCRETGNRHFVEAQVQIHDFEATSYGKIPCNDSWGTTPV